MKNTFTLLFSFVFCLILNGQEMDRTPDFNTAYNIIAPTNTPENTVTALWDVQFNYSANGPSNLGGNASNGIFVNNEFWIAEWNSDTLMRFDADGTFIEVFTIPGLLETRGMTYDGTNLWLANNSTTIYGVDPITKTIVETKVLDFADNVRFISYDETADGGNGGFWVGNFNTDITLFSFDGVLLSSIPQATHTLGGMYGAAVDNVSEGGPYLWVFHQAGEPTDGVISQLQLPDGTPTGIGRNVIDDLGADIDDLAGGMFITDQWDPDGAMTLGGVLQGTPDRLFGYDLTFEQGPLLNVGAVGFISPNAACGLSDSEVVIVEIENNGMEEAVDIELNLFINGDLVATETITGPILIGETIEYTFDYTADLSVTGLYNFVVATNLDGDINNANDEATRFISNKAFAYSPVIENFDTYDVFTVIFPDLYNVGDIPFWVNNGGTPSTATGPTADATTVGNYVYMETSGRDRGEQAILTTNCLDMTTVSNPELVFAYHAFGDGIEYLRVDVTNQAGDVTNIFLQEGQFQTSNDAPWEIVFIDLSEFAGEIIELSWIGEIGPDGEIFNCDIALDEITIIGCPTYSDMIEADITDASGGNNGAIDLTVNGASGPFEFSWSNGATTEDISDLAPGIYTVTVTTVVGNCPAVAEFEVNDPTNINEITSLNALTVMPNPSNGALTLQVDFDTKVNATLTIANALGQEVWNGGQMELYKSTSHLDLMHLPNGIYSLRMQVNGQIATKKVIIAH